MSLRTFSVFVDSPERTTSSVKRDASALSVLSTLPTSSNISEQVLSPTGEKENIHPITGLASSFQPNKKRKTSSSVLSVKEQLAPQDSKLSKSKGSEGSRKRSSSSSSLGGKSKSKGSKDRKVLGSSTNASSSGSSRPKTLKPSSTMPIFLDSVLEERSFEVAEAIAQADIDSRCYDLTVAPLADVSEAFLGTSSQVLESSQSQTLTQNSETTEFESTLNEYFSAGLGLPKTSTATKSPITSEHKSPQSQGFTVFRDKSTTPKVARKITRTVSAPLIFFRESDEVVEETGDAKCSSPTIEAPALPAFTFSSPARSPEH